MINILVPIDKVLTKHKLTLADLNNFAIESSIDIVIKSGKVYIDMGLIRK
jgi:hypothetical protein